jgi:hypothetical protein
MVVTKYYKCELDLLRFSMNKREMGHRFFSTLITACLLIGCFNGNLQTKQEKDALSWAVWDH